MHNSCITEYFWRVLFISDTRMSNIYPWYPWRENVYDFKHLNFKFHYILNHLSGQDSVNYQGKLLPGAMLIFLNTF